jgi:hypothetical protein
VAHLAHKVKTALDEARILALGGQVLLGFNFRSFFEDAFDDLPAHARAARQLGLYLMLVTLGLILLPTARHRLVERGRSTSRLQSFLIHALGIALLPFSLAFGLEFYLAGDRIQGRLLASVLGISAAAFAIAMFYGGLLHSGRRPHPQEDDEMKTSLTDRIEQALTEARVVLPGAQALLGFQLAIMMMDSFEELPASSKIVHAVSLGLMGATTVFLMTPAAYHRIVERGEDSERFHAFTGRMVLLALGTLAPGLAGDVFVVIRKLSGATSWGVAGAGAVLAFFYALWFALPLVLRARAKKQTVATDCR